VGYGELALRLKAKTDFAELQPATSP